MSPTWQQSSHGVAWQLELDSDRLVPGRLIAGTLTVTAHDSIDARGLLAALVAIEHWQHEETTTDGQGHSSTHTVTSRNELRREPVAVSGPLQLAGGETRTFPIQMPVPPLGPASLEATVAGLTWTTVSSGKAETITPWEAILVPALDVQGERVIQFEGSLADTPLPTIELPHGKASAAFHLILATAWARDPHLVRDVTIATTLEL